jgi:hypothetical protein
VFKGDVEFSLTPLQWLPNLVNNARVPQLATEPVSALRVAFQPGAAPLLSAPCFCLKTFGAQEHARCLHSVHRHRLLTRTLAALSYAFHGRA